MATSWAVILTGKTWCRDEPLALWTRIGVYGTLYSYMPNWCSVHRVMVPAESPEVLWLYLTYLAETGQFHRASDPLRELRRPLRCYGGLRPDRLPASANSPRVRCVCKVPYRPRPARRESEAG